MATQNTYVAVSIVQDPQLLEGCPAGMCEARQLPLATHAWNHSLMALSLSQLLYSLPPNERAKHPCLLAQPRLQYIRYPEAIAR